LANGILEMQEPDGSYFHVLNASDFSRKERSRTVYYDGEAAYALAKAFALTGEEKYLAAAEKAVRHFIGNNYEAFRDHWVAYSLNEVTKHVQKQEYFDFALKNAQVNLDVIFNQKTPYHTYFELLTATFNTFKRLQNLCDSGKEPHIPDFFDELDFVRTIWKRAVYMQNYL
jgi:rhamnogalacturonyl hydrolase YesR